MVELSPESLVQVTGGGARIAASRGDSNSQMLALTIQQLIAYSENAGRDLAGFTMCAMPLVATAADRGALAERVADVRARVAFYASTPAYLAAFGTQGYAEAASDDYTGTAARS